MPERKFNCLPKKSGANFTFIAYSKAKLVKKACVQIYAHNIWIWSRCHVFYGESGKAIFHFKSYLEFGMSYEHQTCTNMNLLSCRSYLNTECRAFVWFQFWLVIANLTTF